jgi:hypothetical protein
MSVRVRLYFDEVDKKVKDKIVEDVSAITEKGYQELVKRVSVPGPPASFPGEYPRKRTGKFKSSLKWSVDKGKKEGYIWSESEVGKFLEIGTSRMKPRPWLSLIIKYMKKIAVNAMRIEK